MMVAELSVTPVGAAQTSERRFVEAAVQAVRTRGLAARVGPFGTAFEAESLAEVFDAVRRAHEAVLREGAARVLLELRLDHRLDKEERIAEQVSV